MHGTTDRSNIISNSNENYGSRSNFPNKNSFEFSVLVATLFPVHSNLLSKIMVKEQKAKDYFRPTIMNAAHDSTLPRLSSKYIHDKHLPMTRNSNCAEENRLMYTNLQLQGWYIKYITPQQQITECN